MSLNPSDKTAFRDCNDNFAGTRVLTTRAATLSKDYHSRDSTITEKPAAEKGTRAHQGRGDEQDKGKELEEDQKRQKT